MTLVLKLVPKYHYDGREMTCYATHPAARKLLLASSTHRGVLTFPRAPYPHSASTFPAVHWQIATLYTSTNREERERERNERERNESKIDR